MQFLSDWGEFIAAFVVFFVSHSIPTRSPVKSRIVALIGQQGSRLPIRPCPLQSWPGSSSPPAAHLMLKFGDRGRGKITFL